MNSGSKYLVLLCTLVLLLLGTEAKSQNYITLEGKQFYDQTGNPFFPMVMNYHADILHDGVTPTPNFKTVRSTAYGSVGCASFEGGYTWTNCESSLEHDFTKIKEMGFNTIRLIMTPNRKNGSFGFRFYSKDYNQICPPPPPLLDPGYIFDFNSSNYYTSDAVTFFNLVGHVLDIAWNQGIHVIYLCSDHSSDNSNDRFTTYDDALDYANYLSALAFHLKNKPALLAYDLYNEPSWNWWKHNISPKPFKYETCNYVNMWYDAIHQHDDNHLITLGGSDFGDAIYYDGTTMKLDFISMHLYAGTKIFENYNQNLFTNRMLDLIYWCTNALQRPWIIGEAGFTSAPDACINNNGEATHGTYAQQEDFVAAILLAIRDCGGSGFSWWCFQDLHYYCIPASLCSAVTFENICSVTQTDIDRVGQNYFGLLEYGDPDLVNGDPLKGYYPSTIEKLAADVFRTFNPNIQGTCTAPTAQFYNPFNHPSHPNQISGVIIDDDTGQPIDFAVVNAKTDVGFDPIKNEPISHWHYTFTDGNGEYTIIPYDYLPGNIPDDNLINKIEIGAIGAESVISDVPYSLFWITGLKRDFYPYNETINNLIVYNGNVADLRGYNTLTAGGNVEFRSGSSVEMSAQNEIQLNGELTASTGCELHIFTDNMFPDCVDFSGFRVSSTPAAVNETEPEAEESLEIELRFKKPNQVFDVEIKPNPGFGRFQLESSKTTLLNAQIKLYNLSGKLVYKNTSFENTFLLQMETLPAGVYTLFVQNISDEIVIKKIVKY